MNLRSPTVLDSNLSTRARIREAALGLFGSDGLSEMIRTRTAANHDLLSHGLFQGPGPVTPEGETT